MKTPKLIDVGSKGHRLLRHLASAEMEMEQLWEAEGVTHRPGPRRKMFYTAVAFRSLGLLYQNASRFGLTQAGADVRARLERGEDQHFTDGRPNARILRKDAA